MLSENVPVPTNVLLPEAVLVTSSVVVPHERVGVDVEVADSV